MLAVPIVFAVAAIEAYYLYGYLSLSADYCRSFAQLDDRIGWTLAPNSESCVTLKPSAFSDKEHRAEIRIGAHGARATAEDAAVEAGGLLAIGDSWTFGYGIEDRETFAARLTSDYGRPTALFASPAYSGAQALLLGARVARRLRPRAIIYLELGFWGRAVCTGQTRPTAILKPCYWVDPLGTVQLVTPPRGHVDRMAALGVLPGGMLGAGEKTVGYFLVSRPVAKLHGILVRLGLASGFANDFAPIAPEPELAAIRHAHFGRLFDLAADAGATLVLLDPSGLYKDEAAGKGASPTLAYVGPAAWKEAVGGRIAALPPDEARVPYDGHFGPGVHRLIAALIDRQLDSRAID